jgi:hypothetical protein
MNNVSNVSIELFFNEILYEFKVTKFLNLLNDKNAINAKYDDSFTFLKKDRIILRNEAENAIAFANVAMKIRLDFIKKSLNLNVENFVYLKLHKEYTQFDLTNRKFSKQRLKSVKIFEKIEKLVYKLNIFTIWKIHSIIFVIYLESDSEIDFYNKKTKESKSMKNAQKKIKNVYEIERILAKRFIKIERARHSKIQYRVKWLKWDDSHNQWINVTKMKNVQNLMNEFERNFITQNENEQWYHLFTFKFISSRFIITSLSSSVEITHNSNQTRRSLLFSISQSHMCLKHLFIIDYTIIYLTSTSITVSNIIRKKLITDQQHTEASSKFQENIVRISENQRESDQNYDKKSVQENIVRIRRITSENDDSIFIRWFKISHDEISFWFYFRHFIVKNTREIKKNRQIH